MRLQLLSPSVPPSLVDALAACNIRTDTNLLFSSSPLDVFQKLPPGTIGLQDFYDVVSLVTQQAAAPAVRGDELLQVQSERQDQSIGGDLSTGVPKLDALLGVLRAPRVIEVSGDKGSGKTAFALQVVLRHLSTVRDSGALWIDTTGDFSAEQIPVLLRSFSGEATSTVLDRLQVALAFDIETAHEVLEHLRSSLSTEPPLEQTVRCIVIDLITPLLGPHLSSKSTQGHAFMTSFMRQLRELANAFSLVIFVINSSTSCSPHNPDSAFLSTNRKPALGPSFTFLTDTTLWLAKYVPDDGTPMDYPITYVAEIFRSRSVPSRTWCFFNMHEGVLSAY